MSNAESGVLAVRTQQLSKRYGDTLALNALDLAVEEYSFLARTAQGHRDPSAAGTAPSEYREGRGLRDRRVARTTELLGSVLGAPHWTLDLSPFHHLGLLPVSAFRSLAACVMLGIPLPRPCSRSPVQPT